MGDQFSKMGWTWHVACIGDRRGKYMGLVGRTEGHRPLGSPIVEGNIILKWIFKTWDGYVWTGLIWLRTGTRDGTF